MLMNFCNQISYIKEKIRSSTLSRWVVLGFLALLFAFIRVQQKLGALSNAPRSSISPLQAEATQCLSKSFWLTATEISENTVFYVVAISTVSSISVYLAKSARLQSCGLPLIGAFFIFYVAVDQAINQANHIWKICL
jgi:hypothetical protein